MHKINRYSLASFAAIFLITVLMAKPVFSLSSSSVTVPLQGLIQYPSSGNFVIKCANTPVNVFYPTAASYQANAESILRQQLGLNTVRLQNGGEGNVWGTSITSNSNWATNTNSLLNAVCKNGLKAYFASLSNSYEDFFNIREPWTSNPMPLAEALICIDKLGGNTTTTTYNGETIYGNTLGKNFFQDSRIPMWSVANEVDLSNSSNLSWVLGVCDRIKSYGGKTAVPCPYFSATNEVDFAKARSVLGNYGVHVDYLEMHMYGAWEIEHYFTIHKGTGPTDLGTYDWTGWETFMANQLKTETVDQRGDFPVDHLILGEFGIWRGYPAWDMPGLSNYYSDQDRQNYYTYMFQAIKYAGLVNVAFFTSFEENAYYNSAETNEQNLIGRYGMVTCNPLYPFTTPAGTLLPGANAIATNFGGTG